MTIKTLKLKTGEIAYTTEHDSATPEETWSGWKTGKLTVFHILTYQDRHNGYFDSTGNWHTFREEVDL